MKNLHDIATLNGRFTEGVLLGLGFEQNSISEAIGVGLLTKVAGCLQTIPVHLRSIKLEGQAFAVGTNVIKNVNGAAVPCVVTAVNGSSYELVTTDGKNMKLRATQNELGAAPMSDDEKKKAQAQLSRTPVDKPAQNVTNPLG